MFYVVCPYLLVCHVCFYFCQKEFSFLCSFPVCCGIWVIWGENFNSFVLYNISRTVKKKYLIKSKHPTNIFLWRNKWINECMKCSLCLLFLWVTNYQSNICVVVWFTHSVSNLAHPTLYIASTELSLKHELNYDVLITLFPNPKPLSLLSLTPTCGLYIKLLPTAQKLCGGLQMGGIQAESSGSTRAWIGDGYRECPPRFLSLWHPPSSKSC